MLKTMLLAVMSLLPTVILLGGSISEGCKIEPWELQDHKGNFLRSGDFSGKVLMVNYLSPEEADLNSHVTDMMETAMKSGTLSPEKCISMGIIDCKASWKPDYIIREVASRRIEKYTGSKIQLLFDYKASLRNGWGFAKGSSNIIIIDKNGICRAVVKGRVPEEKLTALVDLVKYLQNEAPALAGL